MVLKDQTHGILLLKQRQNTHKTPNDCRIQVKHPRWVEFAKEAKFLKKNPVKFPLQIRQWKI